MLLETVAYMASTGQVLVTRTAGFDKTDDVTVTLVICAVHAFPCTTGDTLDTQIAPVDPATGTWTATSTDLRTCTDDPEGGQICIGHGTVYLRASQGDLAGNIGATTTTEASFP